MSQSDILIIINVSSVRDLLDSVIEQSSYTELKAFLLAVTSDFIFENKNQIEVLKAVSESRLLSNLNNSNNSDLKYLKSCFEELLDINLDRYNFVGIDAMRLTIDCIITKSTVMLLIKQ